MNSARDHALATLGLSDSPDAATAVIQSAFERLARRYPQPHFPDRFRQRLDARDQLLEPGRAWREQLEGRTLDLAWMLPHLKPVAPRASAPDSQRKALQDLLRAGYLAEPLDPGFGEFDD